MDKVTANSIDLRDGHHLRADPADRRGRDQRLGARRRREHPLRRRWRLSRAIGARGQMMMQQLLVNRGGELPEPELRTSMITLAGTEPSTCSG